MSDKNYSELFTQVELKTAAEIVFEELRDQILKGNFKAGDKLPSERALMAQFERSHPTIREALRRLESAGYISVIPGGGARIREYSHSQLTTPFVESLRYLRVPAAGVLEFIYAADPVVAGLAAQNRTDSQVVELKKLINALDVYEKNHDFSRNIDVAAKAHALLAEMTGNRLIAIIWKCLYGLVDFKGSFEEKLKQDNLITALIGEHRKLFDAILRMDSEAAIKYCGNGHDIVADYLAKDASFVIKDSVERMRPKKASEAIYEQLKDLIYSGEFKPGDKLPPERQLVNALGKSRAAVREALKLLEQQGYITISRGSGSVVNNFSTDELVKVLGDMIDTNLVSVDDIFELRSISETIGAEWAAARRTEEDIEVIKSTFDGWDAEADRTELVDKGINFTNAVSLASHNDTVYIISRITSELMHNRYSNADIERSTEEHRVIYEEHKKILREIEKGNVRGARTATELHLNTVRERVLM